MVSKCNRIASLVILDYKIFLGEVPQTPLTRGGINPPLVLSPPPSCRRHSMNINSVQWPYHFLKADDGPVSSMPWVTCGQGKGVLTKGIYFPRDNKSLRQKNYRFYLFDKSWYFSAKHVIYIFIFK